MIKKNSKSNPSQSQTRILCVGEYGQPLFTAMYDIESNTFQVINKRHLPNTRLRRHTMAFNSHDNKVVVYGGDNHPCLMTYDVLNGEWEQIIDQSTSEQVIRDYQIENAGPHPRMIFDANNIMHVIGGLNCNTHSIYDANKKKFEKIFQFPYEYIFGHGLIYNQKKDRMVMFGGHRKFGDMIFYIFTFHSLIHYTYTLSLSYT